MYRSRACHVCRSAPRSGLLTCGAFTARAASARPVSADPGSHRQCHGVVAPLVTKSCALALLHTSTHRGTVHSRRRYATSTDPIILRGSKRVQSGLCLISRIAWQALFQIITQQINLKFSRDEKRGCPREGCPDSPREMNVFEKFENPVADESNDSPTPRSVRRFSCICPPPSLHAAPTFVFWPRQP